MSLFHPNDLVSDTDLVAYEASILTQFGRTDWKARRHKALDDWLFPLIEARGFDPTQLRTRHVPVTAFSYTSAVYADRSTAATQADGLNLATILASTSDALYLGFDLPFFGVLINQADGVNSTVAADLSVGIWTGAWTTVDVTDGTRIGTRSFAKGGSVLWPVPDGLSRRVVNGSAALYWAKLQSTAAPTAATAGPLALIRRSRLCAAATFRTLASIFREAPTGSDGPWLQKAEWYEQEADRAFSRVADQLGPEFDTDQSGAVDESERAQTAAEVSGGGWTFERS